MTRQFPADWAYEAQDPALVLFSACAKAWAEHMTIPTGGRILELGCCETDVQARMLALDQTYDYTGIDVRAMPDDQTNGWAFIRGDWNAQDFPAASVDAVLMLGALEHVGLGYYGDPKDQDGDTKAVERAARWLKPGGWLYYDVPWNPREAGKPDVTISDDGCWRCYRDILALPGATTHRADYDMVGGNGLRWLKAAWSTEPPDGQLLLEPPASVRSPFWFVATLWRKL